MAERPEFSGYKVQLVGPDGKVVEDYPVGWGARDWDISFYEERNTIMGEFSHFLFWESPEDKWDDEE